MASFNFYQIDEDSIDIEVFEQKQLVDKFTVSKAIFDHQEDPEKWIAQIYGERVTNAFLAALEASTRTTDPELPE